MVQNISTNAGEGRLIKLLVVGSCTNRKQVGGCKELLTVRDFDDPANLRNKEARLREWALPARQLYSGRQHQYTLAGVDRLRAAFGEPAVTFNIISAGYGLVSEDRELVPYEVTFKGMSPRKIRDRATKLQIPRQFRTTAEHSPVVFLLLGKDYLYSLDPPLAAGNGQRLIVLTQYPEIVLGAGNITAVPAGKQEFAKYGGGKTALKGRMFDLLSKGLIRDPKGWSSLLDDDSPKTAMRLMDTGAQA